MIDMCGEGMGPVTPTHLLPCYEYIHVGASTYKKPHL